MLLVSLTCLMYPTFHDPIEMWDMAQSPFTKWISLPLAEHCLSYISGDPLEMQDTMGSTLPTCVDIFSC